VEVYPPDASSPVKLMDFLRWGLVFSPFLVVEGGFLILILLVWVRILGAPMPILGAPMPNYFVRNFGEM
jgi:hypothetical protein